MNQRSRRRNQHTIVLSAPSEMTRLVIMKTAPIAELKTHLSRYLDRVKGGEEVLVTERGVPVARLVPIGEVAGEVEQLRDLERQGLIRLGTGKLPRRFWQLPRPRDPKGQALRAVLEEREDNR